jgi:hypothetical protein
VKVEFAGSSVFQLDEAENGAVLSETISPVPLSIALVAVEIIKWTSRA